MSIQSLKTHTAATSVDETIHLGSEFMFKRYSIAFLLCIIVLVFSEYYFLHEVTSRQRISVLALTISGVGVSIFLFSLLYKKIRKTNC